MPAKKGGGEGEKGNRENKKQSMKLMKVEEYFWYCYRIGFLELLLCFAKNKSS